MRHFHSRFIHITSSLLFFISLSAFVANSYAQSPAPYLIGTTVVWSDSDVALYYSVLDTQTLVPELKAELVANDTALSGNTASCVNSRDGLYYCVGDYSLSHPYLYTVDLFSGSVLYSVSLPYTGYWQGFNAESEMAFNPVTNKIITLLNSTGGFLFESPTFLVEIDPVNGNIDTLIKLDTAAYQMVLQSFDEENQQLWLTKMEASAELKLVRIDLVNQSAGEKPMDQFMNFSFQHVFVKNNDGLFYGVESIHNPGDSLFIVRLDPVTGNCDVLAKLSQSYFGFGAAINPCNQTLYYNAEIPISQNSCTYQLIAFNITTNQLTSFSLGGLFFTNFLLYVPYKPPLQIEYVGACQNIPVQFVANDTSYSLLWNFGDSSVTDLSGASDTVFHVYQDTGVFTVTLISYSCFHSDTVHAEIFVHPFAPPLLRDTVICKNIPDSLLIHLTLSVSINFSWEGHSSNEDLLVTQPGNFICHISAPCGSYSDTLHVQEKSCAEIPCIPAIYPTMTSNNVNIQFNCSFSLSESMEVSIFNILGQMVFNSGLKEKHSILQLGNLSSGMYFMKFSDGHQFVSTERIEVIH